VQRSAGKVKWVRWGLAAFVVACLQACGGGGDGAGGVTDVAAAATPSPQVGQSLPLAPPAGSAQVTPPAQGTPSSPAALLRIEPYERVTALAVPKSHPGPVGFSVPPSLAIDLGPPAAVEIAGKAAGAQRVADAPSPRQIGASRAVALLAKSADFSRQMAWQVTAAGGLAAAVSLRSEGAAGLRLGLEVARLPGTAQVRVRPAGTAAAVAVSGQDILATLRRNQQAGDLSPEGRTYWLPAVAGDTLAVEIELPPGTDPSQVEVAMPRLSHLWWTLAAVASANELKIGEAGSCNVDATCSPDYAYQARSIARMEYVRAGQAYLCTGSLMADVAASGTPYFLGANHCVGDQTTASTLSTYWFYRAASCNSSALDSAATRVHGGATLLHSSAVTDTSFMRLTGSPPAGAVYAGSMLSQVTPGTDLAGLHHPGGDLLKLSLGSTPGFARCEDARCASSTPADGNFLVLRWRSGTTESGSSGSPVFAAVGSRRYVVGHLFAGSASCTSPTLHDFYGRLDRDYPALRPYLGSVPGT